MRWILARPLAWGAQCENCSCPDRSVHFVEGFHATPFLPHGFRQSPASATFTPKENS